MPPLTEYPVLENLGTLDQLVRQSGNNDDDGNRWRPKVDDEKVPPAPLTRGVVAYLFKHAH